MVIIETSSDRSDGPDHTGLVVWVSEDGSQIETVEGNTTNDEVKRKPYSRWSSSIWGFGRPNYTYDYTDIGEVLYGLLINTATWTPVGNVNGNVETVSGSNDSSQRWKFIRNDDGTYTILNALDGRALDADNWGDYDGTNVGCVEPNGGTTQRWYIKSYESGYIIRPKYTKKVLDMNGGVSDVGSNIQLWTWNATYAQCWSIYTADDCQLKSTTATVTPGTPSTPTIFSWADVTARTAYDIKIWNGTYWDGDAYHTQWAVRDLSWSMVMPAGYYEAYVDAYNYFDRKMSNVVAFSIRPELSVVGAMESATFNWGAMSGAAYYNVTIYEEDGTTVLKDIQTTDTEIEVQLEKGTYTATVSGFDGKHTLTSDTVNFDVTSKIHTHTLVKHEKQASTCMQKGHEAYWECSGCSKLFSDENGTQEITAAVEIPLAAHATVLKNKKTATCTESGYTGDYVCTGCGQTITKGQSIAKTGHNYDSGKVTTKATCEKDGVKTYTCANCGGSKTETIKATGHSWGSGKVTTKATCEKDGVKTYTCANCGGTKTETIKATGHSYESKVVKAICTEKGYTLHTCKSCGESYKDTYTGAMGHSWDTGKVTTKATCEKNGVKTYTCANCGGTKTETIKATGHSWDTGKVTTKATCEKSGVKTYTCANCGGTKTETIKATGHSWDSGKVTTKATCEKSGVKTYICANCGGTKTETVKATGHSYESKVVKATCTEKGYTLHTCKNCGDSYKDTYTSATGHEWDSGKVTTKATCEKDGVKTYTCANCGGTKTETIKATGHSYESKVVKPTCTEKGYTLHTCKNCSDSYKDTYVDATGHSWDKGTVTKAPTGSETGVKTYTCKTCGKTKTEEIAKLSNPFTDLKNPSSYYDAVLWAVDKGITKGTSATEFSPKADCTRAQIVTFLWRYAGSPEPKSMSHNFVDIVEGSSYYKAVIWAVEKGITTGTDATHFSPKEPCTRAQIVTFLWRYAGKPQPSSQKHSFTDIVKGSSYYDAVLWAVEKGITTGADTTHFAPKEPCTRAQGMTFLYRYNNTK